MTEQARDVGRRPYLQVTDSPNNLDMSWLAAAISGCFLSFGFPPFACAPIAALALIPLLEAAAGREWKAAFRTGFVAGLVFFGILLWWISPTIARYGYLSMWASWPVLGLLVCYLAFYPAAWSAAVAILTGKGKTSRLPLYLGAPASWVLLEWTRGHFLSGFPWGLLAYSMTPHPGMIQSASWWGPYGISFFIVLVNVLLWRFLKEMSARTRFGLRPPAPLIFAVLITGAFWMIGQKNMTSTKNGDSAFPQLHVAAIQGAVAQEIKWDPAYQYNTLGIYYTLSTIAGKDAREQLTQKKQGNTALNLLIWPETAVPFYFQDQGDLRDTVTAIVGEFGTPVIFGSPSYRLDAEGRPHYLNSAYLLDETGRYAGRYDKRHLVPFGEYLPWGRMTSWLRGLLPTAGQFDPGEKGTPLRLRNIRAGVLICFESIFPELARQSALEGANMLAVITNDAWFGRTGAPWQHEAMAHMRAVETRRWLVRAANTGISSLITPWGERIGNTKLFEPAYLTGTIRLREDTTFYTRHGDSWFLLLCVSLLVYAGLMVYGFPIKIKGRLNR